MVRGFRVFSSAVDATRVRRPTDDLLLVFGVLAPIALSVLAATLALGTLAGWAVGIEASGVAESSVQMSGVAMFTATDDEGGTLLVEVYGRDAWDGQLITSTWTALQNRGETPSLLSGRLARIENEAVVTLQGERAGIRVRPIVAVATSTDDDALLISRAVGSPLSEVDSGGIADDQLAAMWEALTRLHGLGISHGHVDASRILIRADGSPALADLGDSRIAADRQVLMTDRGRGRAPAPSSDPAGDALVRPDGRPRRGAGPRRDQPAGRHRRAEHLGGARVSGLRLAAGRAARLPRHPGAVPVRHPRRLHGGTAVLAGAHAPVRHPVHRTGAAGDSGPAGPGDPVLREVRDRGRCSRR
jgi:hypothetical protein